MGQDLHVHTHPSRIEHWRHLVEIVALVTAAIWAFYVFIYQERIKPASAPPEVQPAISVEHTPLAGGKEFIKVSAVVKNPGEAPFSLAGMIVNVYGMRYGPSAGEHTEHPMNDITEYSRTLVPSQPALLYSFLDTWRGFGAQKTFGGLSRNEEFTESFVLVTTQHAFDAAKVVWVICWSRPGAGPWPVTAEREADGSYWFGDALTAANIKSGLYCAHQRRGDFFPL
jgi:hypothetical protein